MNQRSCPAKPTKPEKEEKDIDYLPVKQEVKRHGEYAWPKREDIKYPVFIFDLYKYNGPD